jgi:hydrogenase maturation protease
VSALVIGIGNAWRRDDAAGLEVARRLRDAGLRAHDSDPSRLLDLWAGESEVIVVDAAASRAEPGTIHRLDGLEDDLPAWLSCSSTHHLGVGEAVELGRCLRRMPGNLEILGIEGACFEAGEGLSAPVARAVDALSAELLARLRVVA